MKASALAAAVMVNLSGKGRRFNYLACWYELRCPHCLSPHLVAVRMSLN